jgi:hypothetical protein
MQEAKHLRQKEGLLAQHTQQQQQHWCVWLVCGWLMLFMSQCKHVRIAVSVTMQTAHDDTNNAGQLKISRCHLLGKRLPGESSMYYVHMAQQELDTSPECGSYSHGHCWRCRTACSSCSLSFNNSPIRT